MQLTTKVFLKSILLFGICVTPMIANEGFRNHGVAAPVGQAGWSGIHAVRDNDGNRFVLVKLWTGSGAEIKRRLLRIHVDSGKSEILVPDDGPYGQGGFSTFLSSRNRFYDTVGKRGYMAFYEYDASNGRWLTQQKIKLKGEHGYAMSFTETDDGIVYVGILSDLGGKLLSYSPDSQKLTNHGSLLEGTDWLVYPELVSDDKGWVYAAIRHKESRIVAWHPSLGRHELLSEDKREHVRRVSLYRSRNGKAYIQFDNGQWYECYEGKLSEVSKPEGDAVLTRSGWKPFSDFGDGSRIASISVPNKRMKIIERNGDERELDFEYDSSGRAIYSLEKGNDGLLYGSTGIPLRFFRYNPQDGSKANWGMADYGGHINDMVAVGDYIYGAVYSHGALIRTNVREEWEDNPIGKGRNPETVHYGNSDVYGRPFVLHKHSGEGHLLLAGHPARSKSGGGMLVYSLEDNSAVVYGADELIPGQGITSFASLNDGTVIGGTTIKAVTGGLQTATKPEIFVFDWENRKIVQRVAFDEQFSRVLDIMSPDGHSVYGVLSGEATMLFYFDYPNIDAIKSIDISGFGSPAGSQAARILSIGPDGNLYILFRDKILRFNLDSEEVEIAALSPVTIGTGSVWINNTLFFSSNAEIWSWDL